MILLLTCEHASNRIPGRYSRLFQGHRSVLDTHRAWDPGALPLARYLAQKLQAPMIEGEVSRLLIELNRSLHHPQLWSEFSRRLSRQDRNHVIHEVYLPYREAVRTRVTNLANGGLSVLHVGVHTFTPVLHGVARDADVGLLYDPQRSRETRFALGWQRVLQSTAPGLRVRRNYPYRGRADGLVTCLRGEFRADVYLGLELEVNQRFPRGRPARWRSLQSALANSLAEAIRGDKVDHRNLITPRLWRGSSPSTVRAS